MQSERRALSQKTEGTCWSTSKCRHWWAQHAFFEGKKAQETFTRKSTSSTLKEVDQQDPEGFRQEWHHNAAVLVQSQVLAQARSGQALLLGVALFRAPHDKLGRERPLRASHGRRALAQFIHGHR